MKFNEFVHESKIPFSKAKADFRDLIAEYLDGDWHGFREIVDDVDMTKFVKALERTNYKLLSLIFSTLKVDSVAKFVKLYGDEIKALH